MIINFGAGPVRCRGCDSLMRPCPSRPEVWPAAPVPYGRDGLCAGCAEAGPRAAPSPHAPASRGPVGRAPGAGLTEPPVPAPRRRRPRRRFDYHPAPLVLCPACSRPVVDGVCRCNDKP